MRVSPQQYAQAIYDLLTDESVDATEVMQKYLRTVHANGHLRWLPEIVRRVKEIEQSAQNITGVTIRSAYELDEQTRTELLAKTVGTTNVEVETVIDTNLIGGVQIETQNERWDFSIESRLRALAASINS